MKLIILTTIIIQVVLSIETTILQYLTKNDQQTLIVAKELFNVIESERYFNREPFTCLTLLPSNLTKNQKEKVYKLNVTINYNSIQTQASDSSVTKTLPQRTTSDKSMKQIVGFYEDYDYDKILDLLHGTCAIHETNEFLYEYCHKEKVRQFDNIHTVQRTGKTAYEDIAMGFFDYQDALKKSKSDQDMPLKQGNGVYKIKYSQNGDMTILNTFLKNLPDLSDTDRQMLAKTIKENLKSSGATGAKAQGTEPQIVMATSVLPMRSAIYDKENLFTVSEVNHKEFELNKEDKVVHLNYPIIKGNKYFTNVEYTHEVTCEHYSNEGKIIYISKAVVISSFDLAFLGNVSKCDKIIDVSFRPVQQKPYQSPFYVDKFREVDHFLYGYVDEFCTNNWDWEMNGMKDFLKERNNFLQPGNTLWLEMVTNVSGTLTYSYQTVTVQKIIAQGVIKTKENVRQKINIIKSKSTKGPKDYAWINSCRIISKTPINQDSLCHQNKILRKNLIKIQQSENVPSKKSGDQILCLCNFKKYKEQFLEMHLTLGKKIIQANQDNSFFSYFEFYEKRTVKISQQNKDLYNLCESLFCYDKVQNKDFHEKSSHQQQNSKSLSLFTNIQKLTSSQPFIIENLSTEDQIMIIDISQKGLLKIHTEVDGQKYVYLISTSMLFKIKLFPNGTKQIVRQNSFYENETTYNYVSWFGNSIFIHKNYIWRGYDKIIFPRMNMGSQKITNIERMSGYAYLRTLNLSKMKHNDSLYISLVQEQLEKHFKVRKHPIFAKDEPSLTEQKDLSNLQESTEQSPKSKEQQIAEVESESLVQERQDFTKIDFSQSQSKPLNKSVSVRYQYFHGDYCGQPINKHRRTNVDLQCGEPWLKIEQVKEVSPCIYELKVSTRLLCRQEYHKAVQKVSTLNKNSLNRVKLEKGLVCYPEDAWDNVLYLYDVDKKDVIVTAR